MAKKQRTFTDLTAKERAVALVMIGRAVKETLKGLDIIEPPFAVVVAQHDRPWVASSVPTRELLAGFLEEVAAELGRGVPIQEISVPAKLSPCESFAYTMRANRGKEAPDPETLAALVRTYLVGYLDAVVQFAGMRAATQILKDHAFAAREDWEPGEEWQYWKHELPNQTMRLPNGM